MLSSIAAPADEPAPLDPEAPEEDVSELPEVPAAESGADPLVPAALLDVPAVLPGAVAVPEVPAASEAWFGSLRPHPANATLNKAVTRTTLEVVTMAFMI